MKVVAILCVLVGSALCSLEPVGYRSSSTYLPPSARRQNLALSSSYLPASTHRQSSYSSFSAPQNSYQPSQDYGNYQLTSAVPSNTYVPPPPKDSYALPEVADVRSSNLPATTYGVPEYSAAQSRGYPRHAHHGDEWKNGEAAKYDFGYRVNDNYGNDYHHQESRNGAKTRGSYSVLLPDGRKQIVEYEADEAGYRPKISYENVQTDRAAYPSAGPY